MACINWLAQNFSTSNDNGPIFHQTLINRPDYNLLVVAVVAIAASYVSILFCQDPVIIMDKRL